jgi:hypothetical protein
MIALLTTYALEIIFLAYSSTLRNKTVSFFETSVKFHRPTRRHNPEDNIFYTELLGFVAFSIAWYSTKHNVSGAQLSRCLLSHLYLRAETEPVSETSCSLEYQTMEKVRKPSNYVCYTPSSEPFRI